MDQVTGTRYLAWLCQLDCVLAAAKIGRWCFPGGFFRDRYLSVLFHAGEFIRRRIDVYSVYKESMKQLGPDDKVYLLDMRNYGYFLDKPWTDDYMFEHYNPEQFLKGLELPEETGGLAFGIFFKGKCPAQFIAGEIHTF